MGLIARVNHLGQPFFQPVEPAVNVSLEAIHNAAPGSVSLWDAIAAALGTLKQFVISLVTANPVKPYIENLDRNHAYFPALSNLGARGQQLTNETVEKYLQLKNCLYVRNFLDDLRGDIPAGLQTVLAQRQPFSIPVIVDGTIGDHIVNLKCFPTEKGTIDVDFFDSKGLSLSHPNNRKALDALESLGAQATLGTITQLFSKPLQKDGHSCGVFVSWHAAVGVGPIPQNSEAFRLQMAAELHANVNNVAVQPERDEEVLALD